MSSATYLKILLSISIFGLFSCADWALKNRCENTNWFDYSQSVAFDGKYLEEDGFVKDCKRLDRTSASQLDQGFKLGREKMCTYDEIFRRGKSGIPVFFKFCDSLEAPMMYARFSEGLKFFCTADSGYSYGKSGSIYKKVCPAATEPVFLPPYRKGRREYLTALVSSLNVQIGQLHNDRYFLDQTEARVSGNLNSLPRVQECHTVSVYDPGTKTSTNQTVCEEAAYIVNERNGLYGELSRARDRIFQINTKIQDLEQQAFSADKELKSLDGVR